MKSQKPSILFLFLSSTVLTLSLPMAAAAQVMADYTSAPPFTGNVVTPNVLFILDNSGSMGARAQCHLQSGDFNTCAAWQNTPAEAFKTYSGMFDSMKCYTYDNTNSRFEESGSAKSSVNSTCSSTLWDGNFLNWITPRRIDLAKQAMIGGSCAVTRNADGTCPPTAGKITMKGVTHRLPYWSSNQSTPGVPLTGTNGATGRMPSALLPATGSVFFHLPGNVLGEAGPLGWHDGAPSALVGSFCVDNDEYAPHAPYSTTSSTACTIDVLDKNGAPDTFTADSDSYAEQPFSIRVVVSVDPTGVVQDVGSRARFGLMQFTGQNSSGETAGIGGTVTVPIGSQQSIDWKGTTIETFSNNTEAMIDSLEETFPALATPLAEALYEGIRYVAQVGSSFQSSFPGQYVYPLAYSPGVSLGSSGIGSLGSGEVSALTGSESCPPGYVSGTCGRDPFFFGSNHAPVWASPSNTVPCCKTFIIVFTDGASSRDSTIPGGSLDDKGTPTSSDDEVLCSSTSPSLCDYAHVVHGTHCQGAGCAGHRTDYGTGSHFLDDVAYWGHINDLRQGTLPVTGEAGHDLPGFQNVTVYTFYAFGSLEGRELLMTAAKAGGFEDSDNVGEAGYNEPDKVGEWDKLINDTGAAGSDGIPDTYFESSNGEDMKKKLTSALVSILKRTSAGSSLSVLASSSSGEGAVYQSYFSPSVLEGLNEIKWVGYTQGLLIDAFGNLREDDGDAKLVYKDDPILKMRFDTASQTVLVDRFVDINEDGTPDTPSTPLGTVELKDVNHLWEAGERLALTSSSNRKLLTWLDTDYDGDVDGGEQISFSTANLTELTPYLQPSAAPFTATNLINFVRGDQVAGLRDRQLTVNGSLNVWKLGDAIHAPPVVVGAPAQRFDVIYGDSSYTAFFTKYKNRRQVAYVGANDGMLHAFNAGYYHRGDDPATTTKVEHGWFTRTPTDNSGGPQLGDELWGFIPQELLPHLRWLADPNYTHVYYVDLQPKVTDARIFTPDADHPNGWGTILMGGFRLGGSCGNCTGGNGANPMTVNADFNNDGDTTDADDTRSFYSAYFVLDITNPEKDPKLLHSFSSADLGLTTTVPSMLRVSPTSAGFIDNTNAKWYMVVGSGPTGFDMGSTQAGNLYALDLASAGSTVTTLVGETTDSVMGTPLSIDRDLDYRVEVAYMGSMLDDGSLPWEGKLHRLTMNDCVATPCSTNTWGVSVSTKRGASEVLDEVGGNSMGPMVASPSVALDDSNQVWVFGGTGRYFNLSDKTNTDPQHFIGVKDSVLNGLCTESDQTNCQNNDLLNVTGAVVCVLGVGTCGTSTDQVTGVSGVTGFSGLISAVAAKDGWYSALGTGERALTRPLVFAGIVFFPTFTPTNDPCASTGNSSLYALYYRTGTAYSTPVVGTTPSGSNKVVNKKIDQGPGLSTESGVHIGIGSENGQAQVCSQNSQGEVGCTKVQMTAKFVSRFLTWHEPRD